jgi:hypothetical protein
MVNAPDLSPRALIAAMEAGNFYASSGVVLESFQNSPDRISLRIRPENGVKYTIEFVGWKKGADKARVLSVVQGTEASYTLQPDDLFVRARIVSSKPQFNPYFPGDMEKAWLQPVQRK